MVWKADAEFVRLAARVRSLEGVKEVFSKVSSTMETVSGAAIANNEIAFASSVNEVNATINKYYGPVTIVNISTPVAAQANTELLSKVDELIKEAIEAGVPADDVWQCREKYKKCMKDEDTESWVGQAGCIGLLTLCLGQTFIPFLKK